MRKTERGEAILTRKKVAEVYYMINLIRIKYKGKIGKDAQKYCDEFEDFLGIGLNKPVTKK